MKRIIPVLLLLLAIAIPAQAQQTQTSVTGTIVDPNSVPYYPATVLACLVPATQNPTVAGAPISTNPGVPYCVGPAQTSPSGTFQIPLYANSVIQCNNVACSTQWQFTVTASGAAPPAGTGPQNFQVVTPITSLTSQDISNVLSAAAPILLNSGGGGGSVGPGTPTNVPCFIQPATIGNCSIPITVSGGIVNIPGNATIGSGTGAASVAYPSGDPATCQTPVVNSGVNIFCSDGINGSFDISANGAPYAILPTTIAGSVGQPAVYTTQYNLDNAPLYIAVDGVQGGGIGQASVSWVSGTTYPLCQLVSSSGNYIAVSVANGATTPGANSHIWYPIPNASRPTQFDCAFYVAQSLVQSAVGVNLQLGQGTYNSCIGMTYPVVAGAGNPGVNIRGAGILTSIIKQTCPLLAGSGGDGLAMLNVPVAGTAFFLPTLEFTNFTLDGQAIVPSIADFHACQQCIWENIAFNNPAPGDDHAVEFGTISGGTTGWVFEANIKNLQMAYNPSVTGFGHGNNNATFTVAVSGGVPTITVTAGGTGYDAGQLTVRLVKAGGLNACSSVGTNTPTVASGVITAITSTATGCATTGNTFVQLYPQINVAYGFKFSNMSDSHNVGSLAVGGIGATAGVYTSPTNAMNDYTKIHPVNTFDGLVVNGSEDFYGTQIDSVYNHGINIQNGFNVVNFYGSKFEWNGNNYQGSSDWLFLTTVNPPINSPASISIWGESCGDPAHQSGYGHFVSAATGVIDSGAAMPPRVTVHDPIYCNQYATSTATLANIVAPTYSWSNGQFSNVWTWNLNSGATTNLPLTNALDTATAPFSHFQDAHVAATSGQNAQSPIFGAHGFYWNGSASVQYGWQVQTTFAAGSGPLATHAFQGAGTAPAAGDLWTFDGPVTLPAGSTATTQSPGDSTTKVATTAFVAAASHSPIFTTPSAATAANISATTMTAGTTGTHAYFFQWSISLTAVGVACTGSTTLRVNLIYQDPNAAGSITSSQFVSSTATGSAPSTAVITIANTGNGVLGQVGSGGSFLVSAASTSVQYSTSSYTAGSLCTTNPTYQIFPSLVQVY